MTHGYTEQIEQAKRQLATWPEWMKINGYFAGSDPSEHKRRNIMTRNLGRFTISTDSMFNMLQQGLKWPKSLKVIVNTPDYSRGLLEVLAEYDGFDHVPEDEEIPFYHVGLGAGTETIYFDRKDAPVFRKERNFNNRFDAEQEILYLWGMFDMIHLIIWRLDHGESIDAVANAWLGLISLTTVQLDVMEKYGEGSLMPTARFDEVRKLLEKMDDQFTWYYDGAPVGDTTVVLNLLRVREEVEELMESIFTEFEEAIN